MSRGAPVVPVDEHGVACRSVSVGDVRIRPVVDLVLEPAGPPAAAVPLDPDQSRVVAHERGPLLVLAGPGTGKTTTLVEAMVARLSGPEPLAADQVLGLTFGRAAADHWRDRVLARLPGVMAPTITTFHAFAWSIVRSHYDVLAYPRAPRLLTGVEEDARVRELLDGAVSDGRFPWPDDLAAALGCHGLADEIRDVVIRTRLLGLSPEELTQIGAQAREAGWIAAGAFMREYSDVLASAAEVDYATLIHEATAILSREEIGSVWRSRLRAIYVDEYQDTDPAQVALLSSLVTTETALVVVGDPDQSIYAFRGADIGKILSFHEDFPSGPGHPDGATVVLSRARRFGPVIHQAIAPVMERVQYPSMPRSVLAAHRRPDCTAAATPGSVRVLQADRLANQAAHIAAHLRQAGLGDGMAWRDMAVLVRASHAIPALVRALDLAGVPVRVDAEDLPLMHNPAVHVLLTALRVVDHPAALTPAVADELLRSPLGQADPVDLRRLAQILRREVMREHPDLPAPSSARVVRDALDDPGMLTAVPSGQAASAVQAVRTVSALLAHARDVRRDAGRVVDVLGALWFGPERAPSSWPTRLERLALSGGRAGRAADRDLDAILLLFDQAHQASTRIRQGIGSFLADLESQQIQATSRTAVHAQSDVVTVMTAHRAKGLQWRFVVVADVREGTWPDLRRRGRLLQPDRLGQQGLLPPVDASALLQEERRLFYVACTRASERLLITTVHDERAEHLPSRFLQDIAVPVESVTGQPTRVLSTSHLVAHLRTVLESADSSPALREAAAHRLVHLRALDPAADPATWWGVRDITHAATPVRDDRPITVSGSSLEILARCPRRWFLEHEARATTVTSDVQSFGSVVHGIAELVELGVLPHDLDVLQARLDVWWERVSYEAPWYAQIERRAAGDAIARFLTWRERRRASGAQVVGVEQAFEVPMRVPDDEGTVHDVILRGYMDRVELLAPDPTSSDGVARVEVFDLKTQSKPTGTVERHPQLALYQLAVREGAVADRVAEARPAGAALVQLRADAARDPGAPKLQVQSPLGSGTGSPVHEVEGIAPEEIGLITWGPDDAGAVDISGDVSVHQDPLQRDPGVDAGGITWIEHVIGRSVARVRREDFPAIPDPDACRFCDHARSCPTKTQGRVITP